MYTMKVKFIYIPEYLVIDFMLMHEIDKMRKINKNKVQSHTIRETFKNPN